jgi:hypothetical protein
MLIGFPTMKRGNEKLAVGCLIATTIEDSV